MVGGSSSRVARGSDFRLARGTPARRGPAVWAAWLPRAGVRISPVPELAGGARCSGVGGLAPGGDPNLPFAVRLLLVVEPISTRRSFLSDPDEKALGEVEADAEEEEQAAAAAGWSGCRSGAEKRQNESARIRDKYPDRIPAIVEKSGKTDFPEIDKRKSRHQRRKRIWV